MKKAFTNEAEFEEKYERFLGDLPQAGEDIRDGHARMESSFRDYLDAFERWVFRHAYECGYAAAKEDVAVIATTIQKGGDMAKRIQIPLFVEKSGRVFSFSKALQDFSLYHSVTGQSEKQWEKWRSMQMKKYNLSEEELKAIADE